MLRFLFFSYNKYELFIALTDFCDIYLHIKCIIFCEFTSLYFPILCCITSNFHRSCKSTKTNVLFDRRCENGRLADLDIEPVLTCMNCIFAISFFLWFQCCSFHLIYNVYIYLFIHYIIKLLYYICKICFSC